MMSRHRFRFFVDVVGAPDEIVSLGEEDSRHLRVIRAAVGEAIDVVDAAGVVFEAALLGPDSARLVAARSDPATALPDIVLHAGALTGSRWDELVDGAVQAGVTRIVPLVQSTRERETIERRADRTARIVEAAAKQAKRHVLPVVDQPLRYEGLIEVPAGVVLDARGEQTLVALAATLGPVDGAVALVVGAASGLPAQLVEQLAGAGWRIATLGPTILRSELAAAVAVSCVAQALTDRP